VDLDEEVKKFQRLAEAPQLYGEFVSSKCLEKLVSLVGHPNPGIKKNTQQKNPLLLLLLSERFFFFFLSQCFTSNEPLDIALDVIDLLKELTDADKNLNQEDSNVLLKGLVDHLLLELAVINMKRMNEAVTEEALGVFNTLSLFENLTEIEPSISEVLVERTEFYQWLLNRLQSPGFDDNKQYASEILAITLQNSKGWISLCLFEVRSLQISLQQTV